MQLLIFSRRDSRLLFEHLTEQCAVVVAYGVCGGQHGALCDRQLIGGVSQSFLQKIVTKGTVTVLGKDLSQIGRGNMQVACDNCVIYKNICHKT